VEGLEGFLDRNEEVAPPHFFRQSHSGKLFEQGARRIGDLQFDAVFREFPIEFRESLRGRDVHVMDRLGVDHQPLDGRVRRSDQLPDPGNDMPGIGENKRRVEPIDQQAGNRIRFLFVRPAIVEFGIAAPDAQDGVVGARYADQHHGQGQQQAEDDARHHAGHQDHQGHSDGNAELDAIDLVEALEGGHLQHADGSDDQDRAEGDLGQQRDQVGEEEQENQQAQGQYQLCDLRQAAGRIDDRGARLAGRNRKPLPDRGQQVRRAQRDQFAVRLTS
jgi:hypothetical protein